MVEAPSGHPWVLETGRRVVPLLGIWFCILVEMTYLGALLASSTATNATAFHGITWIVSQRPFLVLLLALVIECAIYGAVAERTTVWRIAALMPQEILLGAAAASSLYAIWVGHFADGVTRSHAFMFADQVPVIIAFVIHTVTMVYLAALRWSRW